MALQIVIVAPYPELRKEAQVVVDELGLDLLVEEGDLSDGVSAARQAAVAGAEVIISRGGTALLIAKSVDIPVVEIEVSPYDILRCLLKLRDYRGQVGIVGFGNVVCGSESVGEALGITVEQIVVESEEDAVGRIAAAAHEGIRMVIGDAVSVKKAEKLGLDGKLITSGRESIIRAIDAARRISEVRVRERERAELLRIVVDNSHEGIVVVGQNGRITLFNPAAQKIFGISAVEAIGARVEDKIPNTQLPRVLKDGTAEYGELQRVGDKVLITQRFAINVNNRPVGAVASFQDVTEVQRLEQIVRQKLHAKGLVARTRLEDLIGESPAIRQLKVKAKKYAAVDSTLLIAGETGTGKEMLVQGIHHLSRRTKGPFVAVNCAALPENLLESELFGYEEGAFTGAKKGGRQGLFELAHGGTILLDEIGEMPLKLQARLLRVLQEHEVLRVGGDRIIPVDVRIVAATNRNLQACIRDGLFREDLYYRLAVLTLNVPALRERREDIGLLVEFFLRKHQKLNHQVRAVDPDALSLLREHDWRGNVRELEHAIQRLLILNEGAVIGVAVTSEMLAELCSGCREEAGPPSDALCQTLADAERQFISSILVQENFNISKAAKRLGIDRSTLWRKLRDIAKSNTNVS
jgi:PAS domain S-box-containing protein